MQKSTSAIELMRRNFARLLRWDNSGRLLALDLEPTSARNAGAATGGVDPEQPRKSQNGDERSMDNVAQFALVSLTSLLFIVDPIAVVPAYLFITSDEAAEDQRRTAKRACIVMTILLIFFAATGNLLFRAFAITLPAFRTAGGLILWYVAMDMLRGERRTQGGQEEVLEGQTKEDVAITPLAIPMLAGPRRNFDSHCTFVPSTRSARVGSRLRLGGRDRAGFVFRLAARRSVTETAWQDWNQSFDSNHGVDLGRSGSSVCFERNQGGFRHLMLRLFSLGGCLPPQTSSMPMNRLLEQDVSLLPRSITTTRGERDPWSGYLTRRHGLPSPRCSR